MKEELIELGEKLKEIAIKYNEKYVTLAYVNGSIVGNTDTEKKDYIGIYIPKEENNE